MTSKELLEAASAQICKLEGHHFDILTVGKPANAQYAKELTKIISKVSPLVGNLIELEAIAQLNQIKWPVAGEWQRQDPGFPDAIFKGDVSPSPGIEIKSWFPFSTEITARFKESVEFFKYDQTNVAVLAWIPEFIIYGRPKVIGVWTGSARELSMSRDSHYHNPPDYIVMEPGETDARTANLQQSVVGGHKFQGSKEEFAKAEQACRELGLAKGTYSTSPSYQSKLKKLVGAFEYRVDTNFAKIDRVGNQSLEAFKTKIQEMTIDGKTVKQWSKLFQEDGDDLSGVLRLGE